MGKETLRISSDITISPNLRLIDNSLNHSSNFLILCNFAVAFICVCPPPPPPPRPPQPPPPPML